MSYEFKKLSEVEALSEVPEGATVLAEVGGAIKRIPGEGLGGGGGLFITLDMTDEEAMKANSTANMTLTEAIAACQKGSLGVPVMRWNDPGYNGIPIYATAGGYMDCTSLLGAECMMFVPPETFYSSFRISTIFWTSDGFSVEQPSV